MKIRCTKLLAAMLVGVMLIIVGCSSESSPLDGAVKYLEKNTQTLTVGSVGGDYTAMILANTDPDSPLLDDYRNNLEAHVTELEGMLHSSRYTEYSRTVLGAISAGLDPRNIGGYDIVSPLLDREKVTAQGVNGAAWALMALDSLAEADAGITDAVTYYKSFILGTQNADGSFGSLVGSEIDITAMCLRALAGHSHDESVKIACEKGVAYLADARGESGGFPSPYGEASETVSQVILALCALDIPLDDPRFGSEISLTDTLLSYRNSDGGFSHLPGGGSDRLATEQATMALIAIDSANTARCTLTVECSSLVGCDALNEEKRGLVPEDGVILDHVTVTITEGESVFDVLLRTLKENKIHFEYTETPMYNTVYIEGISNLYEFDAGATSGWEYRVNEKKPGVGCSGYTLSDGDEIVWSYTLSVTSD